MAYTEKNNCSICKCVASNWLIWYSVRVDAMTWLMKKSNGLELIADAMTWSMLKSRGLELSVNARTYLMKNIRGLGVSADAMTCLTKKEQQPRGKCGRNNTCLKNKRAVTK